jgi:hypothetical protein
VRIRTIVLGVGMLCAMSAIGVAQRGGMGGMGGGYGRGRSINDLTKESAIVVPKYANAVNLLVEHRQDLALSDTQFVRVIAVKRALDSTNTPLTRKLDSVQRLFKGRGPLFGDPSPQRRDSLALAHALVQDVVGEMRDNVSVARDKAYALLSFSQRGMADDFEQKAEKAIAEDAQRSARGRGAGGRPPAH